MSDYYYEFEIDDMDYIFIFNEIYNKYGSPVLVNKCSDGKKKYLRTEILENAQIAANITGQPIVKKKYPEFEDNRLENKRGFTWGT